MPHNIVDSYTSTKKGSRFVLHPRTHVRVVLHAPRAQLVRFIHHCSSCDRTRLYTEKEEALFSKNTFGGGGAGVLIYRKHKIAERPRGVSTKYLIRRSGRSQSRDGGPMLRAEVRERLQGLQKNRANIRNICILAHVDHGRWNLDYFM